MAGAVGGKAGLVLGDGQPAFARLAERSGRVGSVLDGMGAGRARTVGVVLTNRLEFFEVSMAAGRLGAPFLPVNWHLKDEEVVYILGDAGAAAVVTGPEAEGSGAPTLVAGTPYESAVAAAPTPPPDLPVAPVPAVAFY